MSSSLFGDKLKVRSVRYFAEMLDEPNVSRPSQAGSHMEKMDALDLAAEKLFRKRQHLMRRRLSEETTQSVRGEYLAVREEEQAVRYERLRLRNRFDPNCADPRSQTGMPVGKAALAVLAQHSYYGHDIGYRVLSVLGSQGFERRVKLKPEARVSDWKRFTSGFTHPCDRFSVRSPIDPVAC